MRADWDTSAEPAVVRVCAKCGKQFVPAPYHQFITYRQHGQKTRKNYYCKWSCFNHRNEPNTKQGARPKTVLMYDNSGNLLGEFENAQQAAIKLVEMGCDDSSNRLIQRVCRGELPHYHGFIFKYKE